MAIDRASSPCQQRGPRLVTIVRMRKRRRVSLRESFRLANEADPGGGGDAGVFAVIATALWTWIRGVQDT